MTGETFVRLVWTDFAKIKKVEKWLFLALFGLFLAMFPSSQQYEFNEITHKGPYYSVERLYKISFKSYGQFLRNLKNVEKWLNFGHFWVKYGYDCHISAIRS